ncbi:MULTISPECIES: GNAT family N-acetyltransferase [unclassified Phenylobacterium]|uniref:GNAT family N-acetyltransferase n=1 Tax=unclassified Phenylobacterium TaxID=2640670 RepID=UPI0009E6FDD8|nr:MULTISPECIES: GNAT family N-acetyltransferase [unclassified Phenylobacterium]
MRDLDLRRATCADQPALQALQSNSVVHVAGVHYSGEQVDAFLRDAKAAVRDVLSRARLWVLADGDCLVASAGWQRTRARDVVELRSVYVRNGWTRRGLAGRLLDWVERDAAKVGARHARLHAMRGSEPFYAARGYAPVGEVTFDLGGVPFPGLTMAKPLAADART